MKRVAPLWSDPVGWSEWVAKTKTRVVICVTVHLCFVLVGLLTIYWSIQAFPEFSNTRSLTLLSVLSGAAPILFVGVAYPAMYLYAMHRLLVMLKAQESKQDNKKGRVGN